MKTVGKIPPPPAVLEFSDRLTLAVFRHVWGTWLCPHCTCTTREEMTGGDHCSLLKQRSGTRWNSEWVLTATEGERAPERHIGPLRGRWGKGLGRDIVQEVRHKVHSVVQLLVCAVSKRRGRFRFFVPRKAKEPGKMVEEDFTLCY